MLADTEDSSCMGKEIRSSPYHISYNSDPNPSSKISNKAFPGLQNTKE